MKLKSKYKDPSWLQEELSKGKSIQQVANECEVSYTIIYNLIRKFGLSFEKQTEKNYKINKEWLLLRLKEGKTQKEIAQELNTNYETLRRILKRNGVYETFLLEAKKRKKERLYVIDKKEFISILKTYGIDYTKKHYGLDTGMWNKYVKKYQLIRLVQSIENHEQTQRFTSQIKERLDKKMSVQRIADELGKKNYQIGYFIRKNNLKIGGNI